MKTGCLSHICGRQRKQTRSVRSPPCGCSCESRRPATPSSCRTSRRHLDHHHGGGDPHHQPRAAFTGRVAGVEHMIVPPFGKVVGVHREASSKKLADFEQREHAKNRKDRCSDPVAPIASTPSWRSGRPSTRRERWPASCQRSFRGRPGRCRGSARPAPPSQSGSCRPSRPGRRPRRWRRTRRNAAGLGLPDRRSCPESTSRPPSQGKTDQWPSEGTPAQCLRHPAASSACGSVICQRGDQDAENDGSGLAEAGSSTMARSWVLSPISPSATMPVETKKGSIKKDLQGPDKPKTAQQPGPSGSRAVNGLARRWRCSCHGRRGPSVLTRAPAVAQGGYSPVTRAQCRGMVGFPRFPAAQAPDVRPLQLYGRSSFELLRRRVLLAA